MLIDVHSPVDIVVTAPDGRSISPSMAEIPGASYIEVRDDKGHEVASVVIPFAQDGTYEVHVSPKLGAAPTDTYTIASIRGGTTTVLATDVPVQSIPSVPYTVVADGTPPAISIISPVNSTYPLNAVVPSNYRCTDDGSGIASCVGPVPTGASIDTTSLGLKAFVVNAMDRAGNSSSGTVSYSVVRKLSALGSAKIWLGLKNSDDVGTNFDLRAELYEGATLIGSGQLNAVAGGSSGFNNARLDSIPLSLLAPVGALGSFHTCPMTYPPGAL